MWGPVVLAVVAGHLATSSAYRIGPRRLVGLVAASAGVVCVALVAVWTTVPSTTFHGAPTRASIAALWDRFEQAGTVIRSRPTPLPPGHGVLLCIAAGAGLVAVSGRVLWSRAARRPGRTGPALTALAPSFGLFAYGAVVSSGHVRFGATALFVGAALVFLVAADRQSTGRAGPDGSVVPARRAPQRARLGSGAGLLDAALALAVVAVLAPSLSGLRLHALPYSSRPGGHGQGGSGIGPGAGVGATVGPTGVPTVGPLDLIDNLGGVITGRSHELMFEATSTEPTYWQVATLTTFDGASWSPDPATSIVAGQEPARGELTPENEVPVLPSPPTTQTYSATISLAGLQGRLLPVPPTTASVSGAGAVLDPGIGALFSPGKHTTSEAISYSVRARIPTPVSGSSGSSGLDSGELGAYLELPNLPEDVVALAHQIVAGAEGPAQEAQDLVQFFDSGSFRYTLTPPQVLDEEPLSAFLFVTRAGFCQQFAAAFGVLARVDGLPTRLAVGFATGSSLGRSLRSRNSPVRTYRVTGADAHVWPEVYLGPAYGWVSFEPTPPFSTEALGAGVDTSGASSPQAPLSEAFGGAQSSTQARYAHRTGNHARHGGSGWGFAWTALAVLLVGVVLASGWLFLRGSGPSGLLRRRARRRDTSSGCSQRVLVRFEDASSLLRKAGLGRGACETLDEHVKRMRLAPWSPEAAASYERLARLAERASYGFDPCTEHDVDEARRLSDEIRRTVRVRG